MVAGVFGCQPGRRDERWMDMNVQGCNWKLHLGLGLSQFSAIILAHDSGRKGFCPSHSRSIRVAVQLGLCPSLDFAFSLFVGAVHCFFNFLLLLLLWQLCFLVTCLLLVQLCRCLVASCLLPLMRSMWLTLLPSLLEQPRHRDCLPQAQGFRTGKIHEQWHF